MRIFIFVVDNEGMKEIKKNDFLISERNGVFIVQNTEFSSLILHLNCSFNLFIKIMKKKQTNKKSSKQKSTKVWKLKMQNSHASSSSQTIKTQLWTFCVSDKK